MSRSVVGKILSFVPVCRRSALLLILIVLLPYGGACQSLARVSPCGSSRCTTFQVDLTHDALHLLDRDESGERLGSIGALRRWAQRQGKTLRFATNAGIFDMRFAPLGLFIQQGREVVPLNRSSGWGNFYLKPNGVFYVADRKAHVVETSKYIGSGAISLATQSGPLLVIDGAINGAFARNSTNAGVRSGVGVIKGKESSPLFAISDSPISFYDFAAFFKDELKCSDALYLDGVISHMYAPEVGRNQEGGSFAGMFAVFQGEKSP